MTLAADFGLGEALSTLFVVGLLAIWLLLIILLVGDMFRDPDLSGLAKAGWLLLILVLPLIGIFAYLVVRGDTVGRRVGASRAAAEGGSR
jgi:hypothetical protein